MAEHMRRCKAQFKRVLRQCRRDENGVRAAVVAEKLRNRNIVGFWRDIRNISNDKSKLPLRMDDVSGEEPICNLFKDKFSTVLNSLPNDDASSQLGDLLANTWEAPLSFGRRCS